MSRAFLESQAHQFCESQAHQRNAMGVPVEPPIEPWTIPYARQAIGVCPYGGFLPWRWDKIDSRSATVDQNSGTWSDGWVYDMWVLLESGGTPAGEARAIPVQQDLWSWPGAWGHYHVRKWKAKVVCADSRNPVNAWYERVDEIHVYSSDIAIGGTGTIHSSITTDVGPRWNWTLGDDGNTTVFGAESGNDYYNWILGLFAVAYPNNSVLTASVDSRSGRTVVGTEHLISYDYDPPLQFSIEIALSLLPSSREHTYGAQFDPIVECQQLCDTIKLRERHRTYDIGRPGSISTREMNDTELLIVQWQLPTMGAGDPPATGTPLTKLILTPGDAGVTWAWPELPYAIPTWDGTTGEWVMTDPPTWLPVTEGLWFSDGAAVGKSLVGLLPGVYRQVNRGMMPARPANTTPDNGYETYKRSEISYDFTWSNFACKEYVSDSFFIGLMGASSITRVGDLPPP